ncbi:MAG: putative hydrolase of the superfamily, partial [Acidimicrobiaceae bacterium]|nr:putative hydrolase of the superfamily [Acidimicrobiaceae bacterium]
MPSPTIQAVTFDYWNTLVWEERGHMRGRRLDAWSGILEEAGYRVEREHLDATMDTTWKRYVAAWTSNQQYQWAQAAEEYVEELGFDVPADVRAALIDAFGRAGEDAELHLTEHIGPCLRRLRTAGIGIGIICDVGMTPSTTLRAHLERTGVLELFDHWSFSDEVGVYKPDARIFEHALAGLGDVTPALAAHVGDIRRTDIAGAKAMGMLAVRYTGVSDDVSSPEPEGDLVI